MNSVSISMKSDQQASRVELFVRIVWGIITFIVLGIFGAIAYVCLIIEWIAILLLGKRIMALNNWIKKVLIYIIQFGAYFFLVTDERTPIGGGMMQTVTADVTSAEQASRVELFVRIVWGIISFIVLYIFEIIAGVCYVVQWLIVLITGKRQTVLSDVIQKYLTYYFQVLAYVLLLTDERNPIVPQF